MTPTRELAIQVAKDFKDIIKRLSIACFYGGSSYNPQSRWNRFNITRTCFSVFFLYGLFYLTTPPSSLLYRLVDAIRNGLDILVGTPGRIKDHLQNHKLDLSKLKHVVLDEVDQMLDMGFAEQVEEILASSYNKGE